jgi:hypothetical protein
LPIINALAYSDTPTGDEERRFLLDRNEERKD